MAPDSEPPNSRQQLALGRESVLEQLFGAPRRSGTDAPSLDGQDTSSPSDHIPSSIPRAVWFLLGIHYFGQTGGIGWTLGPLLEQVPGSAWQDAVWEYLGRESAALWTGFASPRLKLLRLVLPSEYQLAVVLYLQRSYLAGLPTPPRSIGKVVANLLEECPTDADGCKLG
jgi:hypothetical protein